MNFSWASVLLNEQDRHFHFTGLLWNIWWQSMTFSLFNYIDFKCLVLIWGISSIVLIVISCISCKQSERSLRSRTRSPFLPSHHYLLPSLRGICRSYIDRGQDQAKDHLTTAKLWPQTSLSIFWWLSQTSDKHWGLCDLDQKAAEGQLKKPPLPPPSLPPPLAALESLPAESKQRGTQARRVRGRRVKGKAKRGGDYWLSLRPRVEFV